MRYILYIIFICLSTNEDLGFFYILPIVNHSAMTINVHTFIQDLVFNFLWIYMQELDC